MISLALKVLFFHILILHCVSDDRWEIYRVLKIMIFKNSLSGPLKVQNKSRDNRIYKRNHESSHSLVRLKSDYVDTNSLTEIGLNIILAICLFHT